MKNTENRGFFPSHELLKKYNQPGPRYTSYPTVPEWSYEFQETDLRQALKKRQKPLSIYFHIPFCAHRCLFCACHVIIDKNRRYVEDYLKYLQKEIELFSEYNETKPKVQQLHWGGGTPNFLNEEEMETLFVKILEHFELDSSAEIALEIDPTVATKNQLNTIKKLGFNRLSMGVQDFDPRVQKWVERPQDFGETLELIEHARSLGFESINLDLIYGLPLQTVDSFSQTLSKVLRIHPERIALYSYAKVPWLKPHQKRMKDEYFPSLDEKFSIFQRARKILIEEGGYVSIGMDHFAKKEDSLAKSLKNQSLHRNFMGYTIQSCKELMGFGSSSISYIHSTYSQNKKSLREYYKDLDDGKFPVDRGCILSADDQARKWVIESLMCQFEIDYVEFKKNFHQDFPQYFSKELEQLEKFLDDNFLIIEEDRIRILEKGCLFIRNIAMQFDRYLKKAETKVEIKDQATQQTPVALAPLPHPKKTTPRFSQTI